ncbi:hypothetical protein [Deinococcus marmoris]|nr:hypothetical protein [Deinococcus marmoris]
MSETSPAPTFTIPALQKAHQFGALERIVELMLEGRSAEVLCVTGGLAAGQLSLGTAEDDGALLDELECHIWARIQEETPVATAFLETYRDHPVLIGVIEMLHDEAPVQRLWALLTGLMIGARSPYPRMHGMIMVNTLSNQVEAARGREAAIPN